MSYTNFERKRIHCKILYIGVTNSGKTETLRAIFRDLSPQLRSGAATLSRDPETSDHPFEFLPLTLGDFEGFSVNLHLYTLPLPSIFEFVSQFMMTGIDGFVFVVDSQMLRILDNCDYLAQMQSYFQNSGHPMADLPKVVQYNHADAARRIPSKELSPLLNPWHAPEYDTVASEGLGVMDGLCSITSQVCRRLAGI